MAKSDSAPARVGVFTDEGCSAWVAAGLLELFGIAELARRASPAAQAGGRPPAGVSRARPEALRARVAGGSLRGASGRAPLRRGDRAAALGCDAGGALRSARRLRRRARAAAGAGAAERDPGERVQRGGAARGRGAARGASGDDLLVARGLVRRVLRRRGAGARSRAARRRRRWTAAAGSAYMHLGLELVRALSGEAVAASAARSMLVERRRGSQSPFLSPPAPARRAGRGHAPRAALSGRAPRDPAQHLPAVPGHRRARAHAGAAVPGGGGAVVARLPAVAASGPGAPAARVVGPALRGDRRALRLRGRAVVPQAVHAAGGDDAARVPLALHERGPGARRRRSRRAERPPRTAQS